MAVQKATHWTVFVNLNLVLLNYCLLLLEYIRSWWVCICGASYYLIAGNCCEKSCLTCNSGSLLCLTCIASHTYLDTTQGCNCNNGQYGTKPLITANACTACYNECQTCDQSNICLIYISSHFSIRIDHGIRSHYWCIGSVSSITLCFLAWNKENLVKDQKIRSQKHKQLQILQFSKSKGRVH